MKLLPAWVACSSPSSIPLLRIGRYACPFRSKLLLKNVIRPQYGFPAATLAVFGADFTFASGTLYIAKVSHPSEQSVASALFQTMQQLGVALGLALTTIAQTAATQRAENRLAASGASPSVTHDESMLEGFRAAQWAAFGFAMLGMVSSLRLIP